MPDKNKGDLVVRSLVIIILGTIAFGLLFNLFTGGGDMEHMGNMGGYSSGSFDVFLGGLLGLLIKLLIAVLVIAVIAGIVIWIKNTFFKNTKIQFFQAIGKDPILRTIAYITIAIIGIIFLFAILGSFINPGMGYGGFMHGGAGSFSALLSIAGLMTLLIKVLVFVLIISLILALVAYIKKQYDTGAFTFTNTNAQSTQSKSSTSNTDPIDDIVDQL